MDVDGECTQINPDKVETESLSYTLDICMLRLFTHMKTTCHGSDGNLL